MDKIDFSQLYDLTGGKKLFLIKLLKKIADNLNDYPIEIKSSYIASDYYNLRELAHKFKSSVIYLKHRKMNHTLNNIELSEKNKVTTQEVGKYVNEIITYSKEIIPSIQQKITELELQA